MFINLKINLKYLIVIFAIIFSILAIYVTYTIFQLPDDNPTHIVMDNTNYSNILKEIHQFPDNYIGHTIEADGYIYTLEDFKTNEFVLARNMIVCCPSDPIIVGFMCKYNLINTFETNSWIHVEGTIEKSDEYNRPIIHVNKIKNIKVPKETNISAPTI